MTPATARLQGSGTETQYLYWLLLGRKHFSCQEWQEDSEVVQDSAREAPRGLGVFQLRARPMS